MSPYFFIIAGLLLIIASLVAYLRVIRKKHKRVEGRFVSYLDSLDRENLRVKTGKKRTKARKNYKKIVTD